MLRNTRFFHLLACLLTVVCVGCAHFDETPNPVFGSSEEIMIPYEPLDTTEYLVTDTVVDISEEIRLIAPWMFDTTGSVLYRLSPDTREAIVFEALYALAGPDWRVTRYLNGCMVSDWNYLASDMNAYNYIRSHYGSNASVWSMYYNDPSSYGIYNGLGRLGQCRGGSNTIWYRSGTWLYTLYSYQTFVDDYTSGRRRWTKPYTQSRQGDIIQYYRNGRGHTAVVLRILAGVEGSSATSVDVVDANWVGGDGQEIIGRHTLSRITSGISDNGIADLDQYIAIDCIRAGAQ